MNIDFLQSEEWQKFQKAAGRRTFLISDGDFHASIIEHQLPVVGKYFYIPRGPICHPERSSDFNRSGAEGSRDSSLMLRMTELLNLAKKENAGWIRFDADNSLILDFIRENWRVVKAPHDMQPKEIFVIDITKPEEQLMAEMKEKTRYNIRLAEKKGVSLRITNPYEYTNNNKYLDEFLRLVELTSKRQGIVAHPESYYCKMFETMPPDIIKLYVAEYQGKVIAANIMIFFGDTAIYLHGASDSEFRSVMAPYLLQWRAIQDAKRLGFARYDFGGVKFPHPLTPSPVGRGWLEEPGEGKNNWQGITKFKTGFSPNTQAVEFAGSYDIIINPIKYCLYRILQFIKSMK